MACASQKTGGLGKKTFASHSWLVSEENSFTTGAVFGLYGGRATYWIPA